MYYRHTATPAIMNARPQQIPIVAVEQTPLSMKAKFS